LRACADFLGDLLLVESEHDHTTPHPVAASYLAACRKARSLTYRVIAAADHGLSQPEWQTEYTAILVNWLREMTAGLAG
jgi:hypothetical protein